MVCHHTGTECHLAAFCDLNKESSEKRMAACSSYKHKRESMKCERGCHWYGTNRCVFKCFRIEFEKGR